jgi:hypothetical protein
MKIRLSYSSVVATLALFVAIGGTTAVGAQVLLTGKSVKDESLTGADIQNDSLTGADIRQGSLGSNLFSAAARANLRGATGDDGATGPAGPAGAQGPAGQGVTVTVTTGPDVAGYADLDTLATAAIPGAGDYVMFGRLTVHNTGANDDNLNCGLFDDNGAFGGGGAGVAAGATVTASIVGAISATHASDVTLKCQGNATTTFDISGVTIRVHGLG